MDAKPVVKAVIAAMLLLEHSEPDEVDPDTAVRGLENIAFELLQLREDDRREFTDMLNRIASGTEHAPTAEFIRAIPFAIGMAREA